MHHCAGGQVAAGQADVLRGRQPLARLVAFAMGFPAAGHQVPVQVAFIPGAGGERWTRTFGGRSFTSLQSAGRGTSAHLLRERFGPLTFDLALVVEDAWLGREVFGSTTAAYTPNVFRANRMRSIAFCSNSAAFDANGLLSASRNHFDSVSERVGTDSAAAALSQHTKSATWA